VTAVPAGKLAAVLTEVRAWLLGLRGLALDGVDSARADAALAGAAASAAPADLRTLLIALGDLHRAVAGSEKARATVRPLVLRRVATWLDALETDDPAVRLAVALASAADPVGEQRWGRATVRCLLTPVTPARGAVLRWSDRPAPVAGLVPPDADVLAQLAAAHQLRSALRTGVSDPQRVLPAVRGVPIAWTSGLRAPVADLHRLAGGAPPGLDDLLPGVLLLAWPLLGAAPRGAAQARLDRAATAEADREPLLDLLLPFAGAAPLRVRVRPDHTADRMVLLRPGADWPARLRSGDVAGVAADAGRRLAAAGLDVAEHPGPPPTDAARRAGPGLAAALLVPVADEARLAALRRALVALRRAPAGYGGRSAAGPVGS